MSVSTSVQALELVHERAQWVAAVKLVGPVRERQHHALLAQPTGEEGHERPGRAIGPVHVLEQQRQRLTVAQQIEQLEQRLEQP
jgi:hypothetical protein